MSAVAVKKVEYQGVKPWVTLPLEECADILDAKRVPINSTERNQRIEGKSSDQLFPYYGATGEVGFIDDYIFDGDYLLIGEDAAPFFDKSKEVAFMVHGKFWVNNHAHILNAKPVTSNKYLKHYLNHFNYEGYVGGTTRLKLNQAQLKKIPVPIPSPEQQKQIVAKIEELFSHVDAGIAALKQSKQLLKQYRQSVLKAAVTGELSKEWREQNKDKLEPASKLLERILQERRQKWEAQQLEQFKAKGKVPKDEGWKKKYKESSAPDTSDLQELPEGWCWSPLGNLPVDVFDGPFGSNLKSSDYVESGVRVIRLENIGNLEFKDHKTSYVTDKKYDELKGHTVSHGDIIFSSFVADGTRVVILPKNIDKAINKADCFCVRCQSCEVAREYLVLFLATTMAFHKLENQVHGATRPRINTTQLKNLDIPMCSLKEQGFIVSEVEKRLASIEVMEKSIDSELKRSERLKQSVLQSAFGGNLIIGERN